MNNLLPEIIIHQKAEWEAKSQKPYIDRIQISQLERGLKNGLIKVITGPRRAGKSVLAAIVLKQLPILYFNFDEHSNLDDMEVEELMNTLTTYYGKTRTVFLDEIQNLPRWELFLNRLQREEYNVVVSGSNAHILSGELATHLTGRYEKIEVFPLSFSEFYNAKTIQKPQEPFVIAEQFLQSGGYPEIALNQEVDKQSYLRTLVEAVMKRDIIERFNLRKPQELAHVADWIFSNVGKEMSYFRLSSQQNSGHLPKNEKTVQKYVAYLEQAYLTSLVGRSNPNHQERIRSPKKVYTFDNGIATALGYRSSPDNGRLLENLVYTEIRKKLKFNSLYYFRSEQGDNEVDFQIKSGFETTELIQSSWTVTDPLIRKRELLGLRAAIKQTQCKKATIVTWSDQEYMDEIANTPVRVVPFYKWALE